MCDAGASWFQWVDPADTIQWYRQQCWASCAREPHSTAQHGEMNAFKTKQDSAFVAIGNIVGNQQATCSRRAVVG
jgi:hypothetical protein